MWTPVPLSSLSNILLLEEAVNKRIYRSVNADVGVLDLVKAFGSADVRLWFA